MNIIQEFDTIAAIATPIGTGGVGVIRISGDKSFEIIDKIYSKHNLEAGMATETKKLVKICSFLLKSPPAIQVKMLLKFTATEGLTLYEIFWKLF